MTRPPVTVLVTSARSGQATDRAIAALRPELGVHDELVVLEEVLPVDLAELRRRAVLAARHQTVVLVDGDTVCPAHGLDRLVAAVCRPGVLVAGPRTDLAEGLQQLTAPASALARTRAVREWARDWREAHRGQQSPSATLSDVVVAARSDLLLGIDLGPGFGDRLAALGDAVVVGDVYWHHAGDGDCSLVPEHEPLLSASLIVRDEEEALPACLEALVGLCDEVVVYDTGSTDRTVEIARASGARVVPGYWDDHFADARNRALAHCTGRWVLTVDADEVVSGDVEATRDVLRRATDGAFLAQVVMPFGAGLGTTETASSVRVVRRGTFAWHKRLHEQQVCRDGSPYRSQGTLPLTLAHSGYLAARMAERGKADRNRRLSELELGDAGRPAASGAADAVDAARSFLLAEQPERALAPLLDALNRRPDAMVLRQALATLARAYLALHRYAEAHDALDRLETASESPVRADVVRAEVLLLENRFEECLAVVQSMPESLVDDDLREVRRDNLLGVEVNALLAVGRPAEAADRVLASYREGRMLVDLPDAVHVLNAAGRRAGDIAWVVPDDIVPVLLARLRYLDGTPAGELLEELWSRTERALTVVAALSEVAHRLPVLTALDWAVRVRALGLLERCPLRAVAATDWRTPRDRVLAAALAMEAFQDQAATELLPELLAVVPDDAAPALMEELQTVAPSVARLLVMG